MEEVLVVVFQVFFEVVVQLLGGVSLDFSLGKKFDQGCGVVLLHAVVGGLCGWGSTLVAPDLLLPHPWLRVGNLFAAPLVSAGLGYLAAVALGGSPQKGTPTAAAVHAALFAFLFGAARLAFAHR